MANANGPSTLFCTLTTNTVAQTPGACELNRQTRAVQWRWLGGSGLGDGTTLEKNGNVERGARKSGSDGVGNE